ncbi:hypothetical protein DXD41_03225 [Bifidobacterium longum]|nr:hypothetical protein DXD41_03225 [Bifidobacterium longum]RHG89443.1 hypothetical protein DW237_06060 [Bifidobacterium longum]RHG90256.1 hypothetical protein DW235_08370 [Bifidobacterium longum]RHG93040.1 hypothetical protein DW234_08255 [Bifidobacterium longum]
MRELSAKLTEGEKPAAGRGRQRVTFLMPIVPAIFPSVIAARCHLPHQREVQLHKDFSRKET